MPSLPTLVLTLLVALILAVTASPVADSARALTNGERFARGLHPNAPRRLYAGSQVDTARKGRRSGTPIPVGNEFTCTNNALCCDAPAGDFSSGTMCTFNEAGGFGPNSNECTIGFTALCCAAVVGAVQPYSGTGCTLATLPLR